LLVDEAKQKWIEERLNELFKEGTDVGKGRKVVSLSMIFATDMSGGYKETDRIKILSG
jgi:hypothetical protein